MYPDEAIIICKERLEKLKGAQSNSVTPLEKELFEKDIAFYEICETALSAYDGE